MASWTELQNHLNGLGSDQEKQNWLTTVLMDSVKTVSRIRSKPVIVYGSAFLQKPQAGSFTMLQSADINGFMASLHRMDCTSGLSLILHTPGGESGAAESIGEYLKNKFDAYGGFEVIIPTFAMSAGTMISLASTGIIMGKHSQLGPIDSQLGGVQKGRFVSARAIVAQFEAAVADIIGDSSMAAVWAPILPSLGPAVLLEAKKSLKYAETLVSKWLSTGMFRGRMDAEQKAKEVAEYFNDAHDVHSFHGKRIGLADAQAIGLTMSALEDNAELQEAVLTIYHVLTILFDNTLTVRLMINSSGNMWLQNLRVAAK